jgi:ribonuclease-3
MKDTATDESLLTALQKKLGYQFADAELLNEALTHSSYANESGSPRFNERLEFLGDAVLELVTSEKLYAEHVELDEGRLTRLRSKLVCGESLSDWAKFAKLPQLIRLGKSLLKSGATDSMSADAAEAVFGAVFLDGGYENAKETILRFLDRQERKVSADEVDPKTELQEYFQSHGRGVPYYKTIERKGPDHALKFKVQLTLGDEVLSESWGNSIKEAEFKAAKKALGKNL